MVVVAVSYLLAATVHDVLGPGRGGAFYALRVASLVAYAVLALTGRAGIGTILACEGVTMLAVLGLWGHAARVGHPRAEAVIVALAASAVAAVTRAAPADVTGLVGLDPTSLYHLAQIPGMVLLATALTRGAWWRASPAAHGRRAATGGWRARREERPIARMGTWHRDSGGGGPG